MRAYRLPGSEWLRRHRSPLMACAATVMLAAGLAGNAISGATAGTGTPGAASAAAAVHGADAFNAATGTMSRAQQQPMPQTDVTLITGDRAELATAPDGQQIVSPVPAAGKHAALGSSGFARFTWAGDQYLVPDEAAAYLASGVLDPSLFDVTYLARANFGARLPVQVTYSGRAVPSLPGLQVSHAADGTATGTLASAQAPSFGRLLASQQQAALASRVRPGSLPGITRISLAPPSGAPPLPAPLAAASGQPAAPAAGASQPGLAYHTLTLNFTAPDGGAGTVFGFLQNVTDSNLSPGDQQPDGLAGEPGLILAQAQGSYRLTVPDGTYSAEFSIITPHSGTYLGYDAALVADPQFTVHSDTTVTLDARTAVPYHVTLSGIVAPPVQTDELNFERTSQTGPAASGSGFFGYAMGLISVSGGGYTGSQLSASPTAAVTTGTFGFQATTELGATPFGGAEPNSTYMLDFPSDGRIPSSLDYTVWRGDLTAYHQNLYANPLGTCGNSDTSSIFVYQPEVGAMTEWQYDATPGGSRTDYWYDADPRIDWWQPALLTADCSQSGWSIEQEDAPRQIRPGGQVTETWDKAPVTAPPAAAPEAALLGLASASNLQATLCPACRQGDGAFVSLPAWSDSGLDNAPPALSAAQFYRNGKPAIVPGCSYHLGGGLAGCELAPYELELPLLAQAASYRLDWAYQDWPYDTTATATVDWTFRSAPDPGAARLPGQEVCPPIPSQGCSYLPLLFIGYDLALNYDGQAPAGQSFPVTFTVSCQQGEAPPSGVSATVSASFDNGKTWTTPQSAASLGGGRFAAAIYQPPLSRTSGFVSLRITAHDGTGDSVTETLIKAYGLTG
jgi:hypothetical protein